MIRRDGFEEVEQWGQFLFYRGSEVDHYQECFVQEQFCSDERRRLGKQNVLLMKHVWNDKRLRVEKAVVLPNRKKR